MPRTFLRALFAFCFFLPASAGAQTGARELHTGDVTLWYRVAGNAPAAQPPIVFLHGGPGQGSVTFETLVGPTLEPLAKVVYFDQRASGRSSKSPSRDYALTTLVDDIEALRRELGAEKIAVLGHSFGGTLALEYAARFPERVSHLIFVAGLYDAPLQCTYRRELLAKKRPQAFARVAADTLTADGKRRSDCDTEFQALSNEEREAYNLEVMFPNSRISALQDSVQKASGLRNTGELGRALFQAGLADYRFAAFDRLTMPALIIAGRHDGAAVAASLRRLADRLPRAQFVEFDGSGHFVYLDETDRFARVVAEFVRQP